MCAYVDKHTHTQTCTESVCLCDGKYREGLSVRQNMTHRVSYNIYIIGYYLPKTPNIGVIMAEMHIIIFLIRKLGLIL